MNTKNLLAGVALIITLFSSCKKEEHSNLPDGLYADIETAKGTIIVKLDYDKVPITVANFVSLAEGKNTFVEEQFKGKPFFNGLKFHRVIPNFMIQGGDPLGNGSGDTGFKFKDEITDMKFDNGGVLAMANSGPGTNSSQFFITHVATPWLDGKHTIFGHVVEKGMDVVNSIVQDDAINSITIIRNGEAAKKFDAVKTFTNYFKTEAENQKKQVEIDAENKRIYDEKFKALKEDKVAYFQKIKASASKSTSGLQYVITHKGNGKALTQGSTVYINYAGYLEDGTLFDSSLKSVEEAFGKLNPQKEQQGGYRPIPFQVGRKDGMIPGFIEGLEKMKVGDKAVIFIPSNLAYGEQGAGKVIPPNANIIFELEMLDQY